MVLVRIITPRATPKRTDRAAKTGKCERAWEKVAAAVLPSLASCHMIYARHASLPHQRAHRLGIENDQATMKSMSHALNFQPIGGLEAIVKFLNLGKITMLAKVREIVRKAKLDVHLRQVVSMN